MCGIYGYIGMNADKRALELFEILGICSEVRGTHATGYYGLNGTVHTDKDGMKASDFFANRNITEKFKADIPKTMIGHTRWATSGSWKINENNHPFTSNRFGFVHNGVVKGYVQLKDLNINPHSECDSEWIFRYFLKKFWKYERCFRSIRETIQKFDEGSLACAMVDSRKRKMWLFRNTGNPLWIAYIKDPKIIAFASTKDILVDAIKTCRLKIKSVEALKCGEIVSISENLEVWYEVVQNLREPRTPPVVVWDWKKDRKNYGSWGKNKTRGLSAKDYDRFSQYSDGGGSHAFGKAYLDKYRSTPLLPAPSNSLLQSGFACPVKGCKTPSTGKQRVFVSQKFLDKHLAEEHGITIERNPNNKPVITGKAELDLKLLENPRSEEIYI